MKHRSSRVVVFMLLVMIIVSIMPATVNAAIKNRWWIHTKEGRKQERSISDGDWEYDGKSYKFGYEIPVDKGKWKRNAKGWWYEWPDKTYPTHNVLKIDGVYYYFKKDGYMAQNEYCYGVFFSRSGAMQFGKGCVNAGLHWDDEGRRWFGSYVPDKNGEYQLVWWKRNGWIKSNGKWYYFVNGYAILNHPRFIDGKRYYFNKYGECINP